MKLYLYKFSDGSEIEREACAETMEEIKLYCENHGVELIHNGFHEFIGAGRPSRLGVIGGSNTRGTGFKTGYHPALGMEIKSPSHYQQVLKEKGYHEVGNEKQTDKKRYLKSAFDEDTIKEINKMGGEIGDIAAEELMKPSEVVG